MAFELPAPVEQITVGGEVPAAESVAEILCHIDHFGIEIADPLHFVFKVWFRGYLYLALAFTDQKRIYPPALPFRYNAEYKPGKFPGRFHFLQIHEI